VKFKYDFSDTSGGKCICDNIASTQALAISNLKDLLRQKSPIVPMGTATFELKNLKLSVKSGCRDIKCFHVFLEDDSNNKFGCVSQLIDQAMVKCRAGKSDRYTNKVSARHLGPFG
jgi:hypothetical protein